MDSTVVNGVTGSVDGIADLLPVASWSWNGSGGDCKVFYLFYLDNWKKKKKKRHKIMV